MTERLAVAVRVRPFLPHESLASCITVRENQISVGESKTFAFDRVFNMDATSDDVYVALGQPLADSFLSGYHASTIAYGQTGAGKTFTMTALLNDTVQEIYCRLAEEADPSYSGSVSTSLQEAAASTPTPAFTMSLTALEVYNETIGDLLSRHAGQPYAASIGSGGGGGLSRGSNAAQDKKNGSSQNNSLQLREDPTNGVYVVGLTEIVIDGEARLLSLIEDAIGNRKTASTLMNITSSRSHCVITLTLQRRGLCSRCCFVDLAGSERLKKSLGCGSPTNSNNSNNYFHSGMNGGGRTGSPSEIGIPPNTAAARMREGININSGLLALGNVIVALCEKKSHVPYRSSKLTRLLQPLLEGHARTAMVACVAPLASSLEETLNTLKYADRAKRIQIDPRLAVASVTTAADAQQLIEMLRDQLEEMKRQLAAMTSQNGEKTRGSNGSHTSGEALPNSVKSASLDMEQLRQLLVKEQDVTKRLENDLFNAEYTAMVEVEKRKALEARVTQLEAYIKSSLERGSEADRTCAGERSGDSSTLQLSPRVSLTTNMEWLQQLEEERELLAVTRAKRVEDTKRLEAALAAGPMASAENGVHAGSLSASAAAGAHMTMNQLTAEIQQKESQIEALQRENDAVSAQLAQYERELHDTLAGTAKLQKELRRAEAQLEKSTMERDQKEQEKERLRANYLDRIRRAEVKATECQRRVREAEQEMRTRQENIDRTRRLQEKVMLLHEEVVRQRQKIRSTKKQSNQRSAVYQQNVNELQRQLQLATEQVAKLHQQMDRKDAAIAKVKKLAEQQQQVQQAQKQSHTLSSPPQHSSTAPAAVAADPRVLRHKIPPYKQTSSRAASVKQPPLFPATPSVVPLCNTTLNETTPVRITKRRLSLSSLQRSPHGPHDDIAQAQINRELQDLERMEKELAELREYREMLLSAQTTDAPKWHRAKEGFTRRLAIIQSELKQMDASTPAHDSLTREAQDAVEKLRQLQTYRHMFEDADEQLAEFENRIENLNVARKFHLQRIRRLQQPARVYDDSTEKRTGEESALPSVRDIRTTRLAYPLSSLPHRSDANDTPQRSMPLEVLKSSGDSAAYTAALEQEVVRLRKEAQMMQSRLKAA